MKNKILTFVIGVLVGAIITAIGFLVYNKTQNNGRPSGERPQMTQQGEGTRPEKPSGEQGDDQGTPPEMPSN